MMGRQHALLGAAGYLTAAPLLFPELPPLELLVWTLAASGWSLVSDIDERNSTVYQVFVQPTVDNVDWMLNGFPSLGSGEVYVRSSYTTVRSVRRRLTGGHRYVTHSWIMLVIGAVLALAAIYIPPIAVMVVAVPYVLTSRIFLSYRRRDEAVPLFMTSLAVAWLVGTSQLNPAPMVLAVILGILLHIAGDLVTEQGVGFLYPSRRMYALKWFYTNSAFEHYFLRYVILTPMVAISALFWIIIPLQGWVMEGGLDPMLQGYPTLADLAP